MTGDSVYGDDRKLRDWLEARNQAYVLAVSGKATVWVEQQQQQIRALLAQLPTEGWERLSAGAGRVGLRWYDWLRLELNAPLEHGWKRCLLLRRSISDPLEVTAHIAFAPAASALATLVHVAGMRWTVEERIQTAKGEVGLDHYEVRSWTGWYRHITLAMWAAAFLSVVRAERGTDVVRKKAAQQRSSASSLARFKAQRKLPSGEAGAKYVACSGNWFCVSSAAQQQCCTGRGGGAGTRAAHAFTTSDDGKRKAPSSVQRTYKASRSKSRRRT